MERKIMDELLKWKIDHLKKPMLLYGPALCGKTHVVLDFGKKEYKNIIYFDCNSNLELNYVIDKNTTSDKLIRALSAISLETIFKEESLIIFDNVSTKVLNAVKKLFAGNSSYHIIMITNCLDLLNKNKMDGFIVKKMGLVTFFEYLKFVGKEQMVSFIEDSFKTNKPMPFHSMAMELYNDYVITGGYPSAIVDFNENKSYTSLSSIHEKNIGLLKTKLLDLDNLIDIKRGIEVYDNMSIQLLKENKKFLYGILRTGARAKEYEKAIKFLVDNNIVIKSVRLSALASPLSKIKDEDSFILYFNDSGILFKKMNVNPNRLFTNDKLMNVVYENNIVSTLKSNGFSIYYYQSEGKAFLDIVLQTRNGKIIPIEIVDEESNSKSKSLSLSMNKYGINCAIRFTSGNFREKKGVKYVPYYASCCVTETL